MLVLRRLLWIAVLGTFALSVNAQDIHFSQFYNSPLNLNPAMTGVMNGNIRLVGNYRNQWASVLRSNAFKTYAVSYDQKIPVGQYDYFGFGIGLWGDKAGTLSFGNTQAKASFSYSKRMGGYRDRSHYLVIGAEAGVVQRSIDFTAALYGTQWDADAGNADPSRPSFENFSTDNIVYMDLGAGLMWFTVLDDRNSFYIGASMAHLNSPEVTFRDSTAFGGRDDLSIYPRYTFHAGGEFMISDRVGIVPNLVAMFQGPNMEINPGTAVKFLFGNYRRNYQAFSIGAWYRLSNRFDSTIYSDAFILETEFEYENIGIGLSYDINVSDLNAASNGNGGFELSVIYQIAGNENRGVYCPNF